VLEEKIQLPESRSKLSLDSMDLNDRDMEIVVNLGINEKKCMILSLRDNKITSVGASILAQAFNCNNNLRSLFLDGNRISDSGVQSLAIALTTDNMRRISLYLTSTGITDASCEYLAQMLRANYAVIYLFLGNNDISDR
jgi:Ran GTPase-activating protein (RanGAP) involved in mRNA processing and transport